MSVPVMYVASEPAVEYQTVIDFGLERGLLLPTVYSGWTFFGLVGGGEL